MQSGTCKVARVRCTHLFLGDSSGTRVGYLVGCYGNQPSAWQDGMEHTNCLFLNSFLFLSSTENIQIYEFITDFTFNNSKDLKLSLNFLETQAKSLTIAVVNHFVS